MSQPESVPKRTRRAQQLARTYGGDRDGWTRVEEYQEAIRWKAEHPTQKSSAASRRLEIPRGRLRVWFNGGKPDPARAVEIADVNGWLDTEPSERVFEALTVVHAWVFAGGSIVRENYVPRFAVNGDDPEDLLTTALRSVGQGASVARDAAPDRGKELQPASEAPTLGRFLHGVLDAPVGQKAGSDVAFPEWVSNTPYETRLRWARTVVTLRGTLVEEGHGYRLQFRESRRPAPYYRRLESFLTELVGDADQVHVSGDMVRLRERATAMLDIVPELPEA